VEKELVVEDPCLGKETVHKQWWIPGWASRSWDWPCFPIFSRGKKLCG